MSEERKPMEFKERKMFVMGVQGSGKTEWVKAKLREHFKRPIIWTEHKGDWEKEKGFIYIPSTNEPHKELEEFLTGIKRVQNGDPKIYKKFDVVVIDDFDSMMKGQQLPMILKDLNANHRHESWAGLTMIIIARRLQQAHTDIAETQHYIVVFPFEGETTMNKLHNIDPRIEEKVRELRYKDYRHVIKPLMEEPYIEEPVKLKGVKE